MKAQAFAEEDGPDCLSWPNLGQNSDRAKVTESTFRLHNNPCSLTLICVMGSRQGFRASDGNLSGINSCNKVNSLCRPVGKREGPPNRPIGHSGLAFLCSLTTVTALGSCLSNVFQSFWMDPHASELCDRAWVRVAGWHAPAGKAMHWLDRLRRSLSTLSKQDVGGGVQERSVPAATAIGSSHAPVDGGAISMGMDRAQGHSCTESDGPADRAALFYPMLNLTRPHDRHSMRSLPTRS